MRNACIAFGLVAALALAGPLLSGCGDSVDGTSSSSSGGMTSTSSSSSSSGGAAVSKLNPNFASVLPGGGTTASEQAQTLAGFAAYGLQFTSTSARSRQTTQPITYTVDAGNGYTTTVTITPGLSTKIDYVLKQSGSSTAVYTGSYTITVSQTGGYTYAGTASWNVPATNGTTYSGSSTTNLTGSATSQTVSGTITATSGNATVNLTINADGTITGTGTHNGTQTGTFSGSLTNGLTYTAG